MKKKGFTLIELLAVIIILAVIALIATPVVLNVIENARKESNKNSVYGLLDATKLYYAESLLDEEKQAYINGTTNVLEQIKVSGNRPDSGEVYINNKGETAIAVVYDNVCFTKNFSENTLSESEDVENCKLNIEQTPVEPTPTYAVYSVGEEVTLTDGTTWIVVKNSTENESEVKLMATSNILANLTTQTGADMFTTSSYVLGYDSSGNNSNIWTTSTLKLYLDSTVKTGIEASLNTTISDITIWGTEELTALGCTVVGNETDGYSALSCDNTTTWYSKVFQNTRSWTKLHYADQTIYAWYINNDGQIGPGTVSQTNWAGARPVITISKSVISQ